MSNQELTTLGSVFTTALETTKGADLAAATEMSTKVNYLRTIKLYNGGKEVKAKNVEDGHFGVYMSQGDINDLGDSVDLLPICVGVLAIEYKSPPIRNYDASSDEFKEISRKALTKDSGCKAGPRLLVFERTTGQFYEYFCGTKSEQRAAAAMMTYLPVTEEMIQNGQTKETEPRNVPKPFTIKTRLAENNQGSWFAPVVEDCLTPFDKLFSEDELREAIAKFENTGDGGEEVKEEEVSGRRQR